jgi:hypothetical protein
MPLHTLTSRIAVATTAIILALAETASARPIDPVSNHPFQSGAGPVIVQKTVSTGPTTIAWVLLAVAVAVAIVAAGYLGARAATRTAKPRVG